MKKSKRLLSALLAFVMLVTSFSIAAFARAPYLDGDLTKEKNYNSIDEPYLSAEQAATVLLDMVDGLLAEEGDEIDLYVLPSLDYRSIDRALDSIQEIKNSSLFKVAKYLLGDFADLNYYPLKDARRYAPPAGATEKDADILVIYSLINFITDSDNIGIIRKALNGTLDLGIISPFIDISDYLDMASLIKDSVSNLVYGTEAYSAYTLDQMIQDFIDNFIAEKKAETAAEIAEKKAEDNNSELQTQGSDVEFDNPLDEINIWELLEGKININRSFYDIVQDIGETAINDLLVPIMNGYLKKVIRQLAGVKYADKDDPIGDDSNLESWAGLLNLDYTIPEYDFDENRGIITQLNDILGLVINNLLAPGIFTWETGGEATVMSNVLGLAKIVYPIFAEGELDAGDVPTDKKELVEYTSKIVTPVLKAIISGDFNIPDVELPEIPVILPEDCNSIKSIVFYVATQYFAADIIPEADYEGRIATGELDPDGDAYMTVLCDLARYYLNYYTLVEIPEGTISYDDILDGLFSWLLKFADGILDTSSFTGTDTIWDKLDKTIFTIIPINWFPSQVTNSKSLIVDNILEKIITLDLNGLLDLFDINPTGELNLPLVQVVLNVVRRLVNSIVKDSFPTLTSLEQIANNNTITNFVVSFILGIGAKEGKLVPTLLKIAVMVMGTGAIQDLGAPEITVPDYIYSSGGTVNSSLKIKNTSEGINTGYTDRDGVFHQDMRYQYQIISITSNLSSISVAKPAAPIQSGQTVSCAITGSFTKPTTAIITVMYNILGEDGKPMNTTPLCSYQFLTLSFDDSQANFVADSNEYHQIHINNAPIYYFVTDITSLANVTYELKHEYKFSGYNSERTITSVYLGDNAPEYLTGNSRYVGYSIHETDSRSTSYTYVKPYWFTSDWDGVTQPYGKYTFLVNITTDDGGLYSMPQVVVVYNDYNLPAMINNILEANRQKSDYTSLAAWNRYVAALCAAKDIVNAPKTENSFTDEYREKFHTIATELKEAVIALDATVKEDNAAKVNDAIAEARTDLQKHEWVNEDIRNGKFYADDDYVAYTYRKFRDREKKAERIADKRPTVNTIGTQVVSSIDAMYAAHLVSLYRSRMILRVANTTQLYNEVTKAVARMYAESSYTPETWAVYDDAFKFAQEVLAEPLKDENGYSLMPQSKVNAARHYLIQAQIKLKKLEKIGSYIQLDSLIKYCEDFIIPNKSNYSSSSWSSFYSAYSAGTLVNREIPVSEQSTIDGYYIKLQNAIDQLDNAEEEFKFTYAKGARVKIDEATNFAYGITEGTNSITKVITKVTPGSLIVTPSSADGRLGTGTKIDVSYNDVTYNFYTVIIYGDVNGDSYVDLLDAANINAFTTWTMPVGTEYAPDSPEYYAADVTCDGALDEIDAAAVMAVCNGKAKITQTANRGSIVTYY